MPEWTKRCSECDIKWIKKGDEEVNHVWHSSWAVECTECRSTYILKPLFWHFKKNHLPSETEKKREKKGIQLRRGNL